MLYIWLIKWQNKKWIEWQHFFFFCTVSLTLSSSVSVPKHPLLGAIWWAQIVLHAVEHCHHNQRNMRDRRFKVTLQREGQEAGFGACWRSCLISQAYITLQRLLLLCGRWGCGPGSECVGWPCSEWTPMVPWRHKRTFTLINVESWLWALQKTKKQEYV